MRNEAAPCEIAFDWDAVWRRDMTGIAPVASPDLEVVTFAASGRGVRASRPLAAGQLLLAEPVAGGIATLEPALAKEILKALPSLSPQVQLRISLLCDGVPPPVLEAPIPLPEWPSPDHVSKITPTLCDLTLDRLERMVDLNAYRCFAGFREYAFVEENGTVSSDEERHQHYGIFPLGSLFNHSCAPNMAKVLWNGWVFLRAARKVEAGEELTQYYCDVRMPVAMRQTELERLFLFKCDCPRCEFEQELDAAGGADLASYRGLYSCQMDQRSKICALEGTLAEVEGIARQALANLKKKTRAKLHQESLWDSWLLWPLVPALTQLSQQLRSSGRLLESSSMLARAVSATASVVPLSNVHLRILAEKLLLEAHRSKCCVSGNAAAKAMAAAASAVAESRKAVELGYGPGLKVWLRLFGFRLPSSFLLREGLSLPSELPLMEALDDGNGNGDGDGNGNGDGDGNSKVQKGKVEQGDGSLASASAGCSTSLSTAWSVLADRGSITVAIPRLRSFEDFVLESSDADGLRLLDSGHAVLFIDWPFQVDLDSVRARLSRKHHRIVVDVAKRT